MARDVHLDICTFRTRGGLEIDFVASTREATWAIDAKASTNLTAGDAAGLDAAKQYLPRGSRRVIVTPSGHPRRLANGVEILPLARLLEGGLKPARVSR